jgi:hypothetical protein
MFADDTDRMLAAIDYLHREGAAGLVAIHIAASTVSA